MDKQKLFVIGGGDEKAGFAGPHRLDAFTEFISARITDQDQELLTVDQAYRWVPWIKRAVKLRANAVSHIPFVFMSGKTDVTEKDEFRPLVERMRELLYLTEMSIAKQGRAYWLLESNRVGKNVRPRFIPARSVTNQKDDATGELIGFKVKTGGKASAKEKFIPRDEMVYFKEPSDTDEIEPGPSDVMTALNAAGLLYAIGKMGTRLFRSGLMKITLIGLPFATPDDEIQRVEGFFRSIAAGVRNWAKAIGMRKPSGGGDLDVTTIGHSLEEAQSIEMIKTNERSVAIATGMSPNIIDGTSASFATANADWFGFFVTTVIPQAERHEETINRDYLVPLGLRMEFKFKLIEIMQTAQLSQVAATRQLVGDSTIPIISVEEAREIVGFKDMSDEKVKQLIALWQATQPREFKAGPQDPPDESTRSKREREMEKELESYFTSQAKRVIREVPRNGS